jgi:fumarylacetoacetase
VTWFERAKDSPYGVYNLPYGVFVHNGGLPSIGVRVGEFVFDLSWAEDARVVQADGLLRAPTLSPFMAAGPAVWKRVREQLVEVLSDESKRESLTPMMMPLGQCEMRLPFEVADYVDFYSSEHHATNVGQIFRPGQPPLTPNWKHLPIGYHGRAGTVVVSGTPIIRPSGQRKGPDEQTPTYGPSMRLDIEAEVGFVVGVPSKMGERVPVDAFADHVFGVVLLNDWSARDLQAWEAVPLGPFLGKSFATSISAWVTPLAALEHARIEPPTQDPGVLPYLIETDRKGLDLQLKVEWNGTEVSRPPARALYWTAAQQLAHMTVNGASLRTGDLYASGTVSGPERDQRGSFLELSWGGADPIKLIDGSERTFMEDGDTVTITATAPGKDGSVIALGEVSGTISPAV